MAEREAVEFRPDDNRETAVRLSVPERVVDGISAFTVAVEAEGLRWTRSVELADGDGLHRFLSDLASDWQGWNGVRRWDALAQGMTIEATHRGNRVELRFTLRRDCMPDAWEVQVPVLVAPGESLSRLARAVADLLQLG